MARQGVKTTWVTARVLLNEDQVEMISHRTSRAGNFRAKEISTPAGRVGQNETRYIFRGCTKGRIVEGFFEARRNQRKFVVCFSIDLIQSSFHLGLVFTNDEIPVAWQQHVANQRSFDGFEEERFVEETSGELTVRAQMTEEMVALNGEYSIFLTFSP